MPTSLASHWRRSVSTSSGDGPDFALSTASCALVLASTPSTPDVHGVAMRIVCWLANGADRQIGVPSFVVAETANQN